MKDAEHLYVYTGGGGDQYEAGGGGPPHLTTMGTSLSLSRGCGFRDVMEQESTSDTEKVYRF